MSSLMIRIIKQMKNDKRSLALILFAPILILTLLYLLLGDSAYTPTIAVKDFPPPVLAELKKQNVTIVLPDSSTDMDEALKNKEFDAFLSMGSDGISIRMMEADSTKLNKVTDAVKTALTSVNPSAGMHITFLYGQTQSTVFDSLGFMLLGVLSFFFVFLISGISFVRERTSGTMERFMLTPIRRAAVVGGYTLGLGLFAAIQSILVVLFTKYVLKMQFEGSVLLAILIMILLAFTAVSLGALVSIFANNEFQVIQFIPIIIIPQIFFSGLIPIDTLPYGLGNLSYIMPVFYGCTGLENVLVKGYGLEQIYLYICALLAFIGILFLLNTLALKKYRKL